MKHIFFIFALLIGLYQMPVLAQSENKAQEKNSDITESMIDEYLKLAFSQKNKVVRYEEEELKARMIFFFDKETHERSWLGQFQTNIQRYQELTGMKIRFIPPTEVEDNTFLKIIISTNLSIADLMFKTALKERFYPNLQNGDLKKAYQKELIASNFYKGKDWIRKNGSLNLSISLIDANHKSVSKAIHVNYKINLLFAETFTFTAFNKKSELVSIFSLKRKYNDLQPLDIAYIKATYSDAIQAGMSASKAIPFLKKHMLDTLNIR